MRHRDCLRIYDAGVEALACLGLHPSEETSALINDLRQSTPQKRRKRTISDLPLPTDSFFGRTSEIRSLEAAVAEGARLITLTGPGGMGKTRLAIEFARTVTDRNVHFVSLAAVTQADLAGEAILQALNAARAPSLPLWEQVASCLRHTPSLLLLDNFEQLPAEASAQVAQVVLNAPNLACLVTSRRLLEISGEREVTLGSLPHSHAAGLFLQRARTARPEFTAETPTLTQIVSLLDGMPLALEMAAARALTLTAEEILAGLADRIAFLRSRRVDVAERHRSIETALSWSWDLLPPELREIHATLSVFQGSFTREAAEAVCFPPSPLLDTLETLRAHSLLAVTGEPPRFRQLETIRTFAQERLSETSREKARRKHAAYFTARLERGDSCRAERENLQATARYLEHSEDREAHLRFIGAFRVRHWTEGFFETWEMCKPALLLSQDPVLPLLLRGRALAAYAMAGERIEQGSRDLFQDAAALLAESGEDEPLRAFALQYIGTQEKRDEAEQVARRADEPETLSWVLTIQGNCASQIGDWEQAERYWQEALATALRLYEPRHRDFVRSEWSFYLLHRGDYLRALALLKEVQNYESCGNWNYPRLLIALGRYDHARTIAQSNSLFYMDQGAAILTRTAYGVQTIAHLCLGEVAAAQEACEQAEATTGTPNYRLRSEIALVMGEPENAAQAAQLGLEQYPTCFENFYAGYHAIPMREALARAEAAAGRDATAWALLTEAMSQRLRFGVRQMQCENLETCAALLARGGTLDRAALLLRASDAAREERSNPCLPYLRQLGDEARKRIPQALLAEAPLLALDAAVAAALK